MPAGVGRPPRGSRRERTAAANRAGTEEEEVASLSNEFFKILRPGMYEKALALPAKIAPVLGGRRRLNLQLAGGDRMPLWEVEVFVDEKHGDMYLGGGGGWEKFARSHGLEEGYVLVFRYGGRGDLIVTVFDLTTCRKEYYLNDDGDAEMRGAEEEMAGLINFEFFKILHPGMYEKALLGLPAKLAPVLGGRRDLMLQVAGGDTMPLWDVEVLLDEKRGDIYLGGGGWKEFARFYDLRQGYALVFRYGGRGDLIVTVFDDLSTCRKEVAGAGAGAGRGPLPIAEPSQFAVTLRKCNLEAKKKQYLHVPVEFHSAHGYLRRRRVVLQMGGRSWLVNLKHNRQPPRERSSFRYGWHQFCLDNSLEVGDYCFFQVIREGSGCRGDDDEDEEWEQDEEDDDDKQVLKVEVRKKNGKFVS